MRLILYDVLPDDWPTAIRAGHWLYMQPHAQRDAILSYGSFGDFYVKRNKASITVRPLEPAVTSGERS